MYKSLLKIFFGAFLIFFISLQSQAYSKTVSEGFWAEANTTFLGQVDVTFARKELHFLWLGKAKPSKNEVKALLKGLKPHCNVSLCDFMIWDNQDAFKNRNPKNINSSVYATNHKLHLAGFLNSGQLFYYYGRDREYFNIEE